MPPYTTQLSPIEEMQFQDWIRRNKIRDLNEPDSFYDYRGFWKSDPNFEHLPGQHFVDTYKQPGHPTFSNESQYATTSNFGGRWFDNDIYAPQLSTSRQSVNPTQLAGSVRYLVDKLFNNK